MSPFRPAFLASLASIALAGSLTGCATSKSNVRGLSKTSHGACSCVCTSRNRASFPMTDTTYFERDDQRGCALACQDSTRIVMGSMCKSLFLPGSNPVTTVASAAEDPSFAGSGSVPLPAASTDSQDHDGDGILDADDRCPNEYGAREAAGCPDRDSDRDGVVDRLDKCASQPGSVAYSGCPEPDGDGDGLPDSADRCPSAPETRNGFEDQDGCPDEVPSALQQFEGSIEGVVFKTGSAEIDAKSFPILEKAARVLAEYSTTRVEISGHTDNVGNPESNTTLSANRAESVKRWLVGKGIAADRMETRGYGPDKPIDDNSTEKGRARNRRVEFRRL